MMSVELKKKSIILKRQVSVTDGLVNMLTCIRISFPVDGILRIAQTLNLRLSASQ